MGEPKDCKRMRITLRGSLDSAFESLQYDKCSDLCTHAYQLCLAMAFEMVSNRLLKGSVVFSVGSCTTSILFGTRSSGAIGRLRSKLCEIVFRGAIARISEARWRCPRTLVLSLHWGILVPPRNLQATGVIGLYGN